MTAYTLMATKPKLKKADATSRTQWQEGASSGCKRRTRTPTVARAAGDVPEHEHGAIRRTAALDRAGVSAYRRQGRTGLEGGWDFTFSFSPQGVLQLNRKPGENAASGEAPIRRKRSAVRGAEPAARVETGYGEAADSGVGDRPDRTHAD